MRRLHGKETRRYVKYDDEDYSIFLELRLPGNPVWLRISPFLARELKEEADREELAAAKKSLRMPIRKSTPVVDLASNFSPVLPRPLNRPSRHGESQTDQLNRINQNLRAESMNYRDAEDSDQASPSDQPSTAFRMNPGSDNPPPQPRETTSTTEQNWMPPSPPQRK